MLWFRSQRKRSIPWHWVTAAAAQDDQGIAGGGNNQFDSQMLSEVMSETMCKGEERQGVGGHGRQEHIAG